MAKINMHEAIDHDRRRFFGAAALTFTAAELGVIGAAHGEAKPAPLSVIKPGTNTSFAPLKQIASSQPPTPGLLRPSSPADESTIECRMRATDPSTI
jgi:hypothetical protein